MEFKGQNIILRQWIDSDFENYLYYHSKPFKWMDFNAPYFPKKTINNILNEIELIKTEIKTNENKRFVIADIESNTLIGTVSWYWQCQHTNWKSIGIAIYNGDHWGKGLGYEALAFWIDYLFNTDESLGRLDMRTWSGNKGLIRLAEKLQFKLEGQFREARTIGKSKYDSLAFGILRSEWKTNHPNGFKLK